MSSMSSLSFINRRCDPQCSSQYVVVTCDDFLKKTARATRDFLRKRSHENRMKRPITFSEIVIEDDTSVFFLGIERRRI